MKYLIQDEVFAIAPCFCRAVIVARNIDNGGDSQPLADELASAVREIVSDPTMTQDHPRIAAWQAVYKSFPTPKKERIRPSIGSLVSRIRSGLTELPFISPLVAISNVVSLSNLMPSGLIDLDRIDGDLVLGPANGQEQFTAFGKTTTAPILPGEIIYYSSADRAVYESVYKPYAEDPFPVRERALALVAGEGFEPSISGL